MPDGSHSPGSADAGHLVDGDGVALLVHHRQSLQHLGVHPLLGGQANHDVVLVGAVAEVTRLLAGDGGAYGAGHGKGAHPRELGLGTIHLHPDLRTRRLIVVLQIHEPGDGGDAIADLTRDPAEGRQIVPSDLDGHRCAGGRPHLGLLHLRLRAWERLGEATDLVDGLIGVLYPLSFLEEVDADGGLVGHRLPDVHRARTGSGPPNRGDELLHVGQAGEKVLDGPYRLVGRLEVGAVGRLHEDAYRLGGGRREELYPVIEGGIEEDGSQQPIEHSEGDPQAVVPDHQEEEHRIQARRGQRGDEEAALPESGRRARGRADQDCSR